ncbi:MAG: hypothetical protein ACREU0_11430, partial [Burkholderiales bacterium]
MLNLTELCSLCVEAGFGIQALPISIQHVFLKFRDLSAVANKIAFRILLLLGSALLLFADFHKFQGNLFSAMPELLCTLSQLQHFNLDLVLLLLYCFN